MSWEDILKEEEADDDWEAHVSRRKEAQSEADMGNYTGAEYEDGEFDDDENFHMAFSELGGLIATLEHEIAPHQPQQNNPSRAIMDKIKAIRKHYDKLDKLRLKR